MKLREYLLRNQILIVALPICILSVILFRFISRDVQEEIYYKNDTIAHAMAKHITETLETPVHLLQQIRAMYGNMELAPAQRDLLVAQIVKQEPCFDRVDIVDQQGRVKGTLPERRETMDLNYSRDDFFLHIKQGEQIYWSNSFISPRTGRPMVIMAVPMGPDMLVAYLNLDRISNLSETFGDSFGQNTDIAVTDAKGVFISHFQRERVLQRQRAEQFTSLLQDTHNHNESKRMEIAGRDYLVNFVELPQQHWYVIVYQATDSAFAILRRLALTSGLTAFFVFAGALLISRRRMNTVANAFSLLKRRFAEIAAGNFSGQVQLGRFSEFNEIAGYFNHMVASIRERDESLKNMAYQDSLTGLPNRVCFDKWLQDSVATTGPEGSFAVIFLDLDNFKVINDTHGHWLGDEILRAMAERLRGTVDEETFLARFGGDEFVFVVKNWAEEKGRHWLNTMRELLSAPVELGGYSFCVRVSIGAAVFPEDSRHADELLKYADMAMYQAKAAGKNGCQFYTARMHALFQRKTSIEEALRTALERREFTLYYQPLLTTDGGTLRGFEALIRWNCNSMGFVPPLEFIAVAEEIGIINDIGRWVLHTACAKLAALTGKTGKALIMAVNISAHQLKDVNFIKDVADALAAYDLQPAQLELEITESAVIDSMEETVAALQKLRSLGVKVSLDDFGTGYSSLSYLHQLPIDTIKIDKSFFRDIVANQRARDMLAGIVYLARKLGLNVVTEGIENKEQVAYIRGIDCDFAQGYYYKKPMPADETEEFCARWSEAPLSGEVTS